MRWPGAGSSAGAAGEVAAFIDVVDESRKPANGSPLRRQHGSRQTQAAPLGELAVERVLAPTHDRLIDRRDLALLMVARDMLGSSV